MGHIELNLEMAKKTLSALNDLMSEAVGGSPVRHWDVVNEVCVFYEKAIRDLSKEAGGF